jgi:hypothetical protein
VAEIAECDRGRDQLRLRHLVQALADSLSFADAGGVDCLRRDEGGALLDLWQVEVGEKPLEQAGLADDDVDHVDAALLGHVLLPGDVHERLDVVGRIREEDVLVGRDEPEDPRDDGER